MNLRIGQKVVCIKQGRWEPFFPSEISPVCDGVYTIRGFGGNNGLCLEEIVNVPELYFCVHCFRPLIERKTDAGMAVLRKVADDASKRRNLVGVND